MIKTVVFDFDGVVIDSRDHQKEVLKKCFEEFYPGEPLPITEFFRHSGNSLENIFSKMNLPQEMVAYYREVSEKTQGVHLVEGMSSLLNSLQSASIGLALYTGKERKRTEKILDTFSISACFDLVVCCDDVTQPKPNPEGLLNILQKTQTNRDDCVMVGDSQNDQLCAMEAGVEFIGVNWGETSWAESSLKSVILVETVIELEGILMGNVRC